MFKEDLKLRIIGIIRDTWKPLKQSNKYSYDLNLIRGIIL